MNVAVTKPVIGTAPEQIFVSVRDRLPGSGGVPSERQRALDVFVRQGLPNRRVEDWKYTDLRVLMREVLTLAPAPDQAAIDAAMTASSAHAIEGVRKLVLVDGAFVPGLSDMSGLEAGLQIRTLQETLESGVWASDARLGVSDKADPMVALNAALMTDGVFVDVAAGIILARPIHVIHVATTPAAIFTRSQLRLGKAAAATLVESFITTKPGSTYQVHDAVMIDIADSARLDHIRLVEDSREAFNIASASVRLGAGAHLNALNFTSGASVSRYQAFIEFAGESAHASINGVNLLNGRQHGDTTVFLDHAVPNCTSREVFRAVLDDRGHSVFQGRIIVRPGAQKTDAKMMTRALLLSDEAEADNKPELEIFADDVTCGHGATTGALDESLLFYLCARGLSEKEAQALLIQAFVGEAIESIADDRLRDLVAQAAERWLAARA